jgi:competence protein ComEC
MVNLRVFLIHHPALLYAFSWYCGTLLGLEWTSIFLALLYLFVIAIFSKARLAHSGCFFLAFLYVFFFFTPPKGPLDAVLGIARIEVTKLQPMYRYGTWSLAMHAEVRSFCSNDSKYYFTNFPCSLTYTNRGKRPCGGVEYELPCLLSGEDGRWNIKPLVGCSEWKVASKTWSLTEWRYRVKNHLKIWFARHISPGESRDFLQGIFLGEFCDKTVAKGFAQCGLQHVLVVSGFHFSLLLLFFSLFFKLFFSRRISITLLFLLSSLYVAVIGLAAPVLRAWCQVAIFILSKIVKERASSLNSLGIAVIVALALKPMWVHSVSFQLSFLATFAILLFSAPVFRGLKKFFPSYEPKEIDRFRGIDQVVVIFSASIQKAFACALAVAFVTWPYLLGTFGTFSLQSIFYNCFFPCLVACIMFMTCFGALFCWYDPIAKFLFSLVEKFTSKILAITSHMPVWMEHSLSFALPDAVVCLYYLVLFVVGVVLYSRDQEARPDTG